MTMPSATPVTLGIGDAAVIAALGYGVVFLGLILLMLVVIGLGKCFIAAEKRKTVPAAAEPAPAPQAPAVTAPGSAGQLKLHNVDPKTAAMLMAIVADKLQQPLNELRFVSIKEVE